MPHTNGVTMPTETDPRDYHYHVGHHIAGYLPESDVHTAESLSDALSVLADDLAYALESVWQGIDYDESHELAHDLEMHERNVESWLTTSERLESEIARDPDQLRVDDENYPVDYARRHGISVHLEDGRALPVVYWLEPCSETHVRGSHGIGQLSRESDGGFPSYAWPGGYPLLYSTRRGDLLCATCARESVDQGIGEDPAESVGTYDEGPPIACDGCGTEIPSSYGDPDSES